MRWRIGKGREQVVGPKKRESVSTGNLHHWLELVDY